MAMCVEPSELASRAFSTVDINPQGAANERNSAPCDITWVVFKAGSPADTVNPMCGNNHMGRKSEEPIFKDYSNIIVAH